MKKSKKFFSRLFKPGSGENEVDKILILLIGLLVFSGLVMLSSASSVVGYKKFGNSYYYFNHQLFITILGVAIFYIFSRINYFFWKRYAFGFLLVSCLFLLLVFIPGLGAHYGKAQSWINLFGFSLQPSEFVKVFFLIYLAAWLERRGEDLKTFSQGLGPFILILMVIAFLMILQPDVGTLSIVVFSSLAVYFLGGGKISHLLMVCLIGMVVLFGILEIKPYIKDRFACVVNPQLDVKDECYQVNQSLLAVGSGGLWGR